MIGETAKWAITHSVWWGGHEDTCSYKLSDRKDLCDCKVMQEAVEADRKADAGELDVDYVFDLAGAVVKVGDRVAYAATDGRSAGLRLGKVIEVRAAHVKKETHWDSDVPCKLRIEVEDTSGFSSINKPVLIATGMKRFVKIV